MSYIYNEKDNKHVPVKEADPVERKELAAGFKDDANKDRMDLIPPEFMFALARILSFGVKKYAARNWEKGMSYSRVFGALMRHMWAWWGGNGPTSHSFLLGSLDEETGMSHLWHAAFCIMVLVTYEDRGMDEWDDRHKDPAKGK